MRAEQKIPSLSSIFKSHERIELTSSGSSMYPLIREGDVCTFVSVTKAPQINIGDIVLFVDRENRLIGHRCVRIRKQGDTIRFTFKGDCNTFPDSPVYPEQLIGRLERIQRGRRTMPADRWTFWMWGKLLLHVPSFTRVLQFIRRRQLLRL